MTLKQAIKVIDNEENVSIEDIMEARRTIASKEKKKTDPKNSLKSHEEWKRRNKEINDIRKEILKYWTQKSI
jgi:replication initiation and membrane attachment protein DnaB